MIEGIPLAMDFRRGSMRLLHGAEGETQQFDLPREFEHDKVLGILRGQLAGVSHIIQVVWHIPLLHLTPQEQCWTGLSPDRLAAELGVPVRRVTDTNAVVKYITTDGLSTERSFGLVVVNDSTDGTGGAVRTYVIGTDGELRVIVPEGHSDDNFLKWEMTSLHESPTRLIQRADVLRRRQAQQGTTFHKVFVWSEDVMRLPRRMGDCSLAPLADDESPCTVNFLADPLAHLVGAMRFTG